MAILAVIIGLEVGGRFGRKLGLHADDIWNTGLIALVSGLIVARLWNVFQFWPIYSGEPLLIVSLRPSGFSFWPGAIAAAIGGYAYLIRRALDPVRVVASLSIGAIAGGAILALSGYLTGAILGLPSDLPWALSYFGEDRHPAGLYQALGLGTLALLLWYRVDPTRPGRIILWSLFGYSLLRLFTDGFRDAMDLLGAYRLSQLIALAVALACIVLLARDDAAYESQSASQRNASETDAFPVSN